jgi:hypothetical protein
MEFEPALKEGRMMEPPDEPRELRERMTKQALADTVRRRLAESRRRQTDVARWSGMSRSFVQSVLRGQQNVSLFLFLELSHGLGIDDPCELLRDVLRHRDLIRSLTSRRQEGTTAPSTD